MTTQDYTDHTGSDFADVDAGIANLLAELDWLDDEGVRLALMGLRELRRNIRAYAFRGKAWDIDISVAAGSGGLTVIFEDSGPEIAIARRAGVPDPSGSGDHRLRILDLAFDQVTYDRALGRSRWVLRRFARQSVGAVLVSSAA